MTRESRDRVEGEKGQQTRRGLRGEVRHPREAPEVRSDPVRAKWRLPTRQSPWGDSQGARVWKTEFLSYHWPTDQRATYRVGTSRFGGRGGTMTASSQIHALQKKGFVEMTSLWKAWKSLPTFPHFPQWLGYRFAESTFPQSRRRSFLFVHKDQIRGT